MNFRLRRISTIASRRSNAIVIHEFQPTDSFPLRNLVIPALSCACFHLRSLCASISVRIALAVRWCSKWPAACLSCSFALHIAPNGAVHSCQ
eukprot:scaffold106636_cov36-Phaeocystis_antarctica.AAC.3